MKKIILTFSLMLALISCEKQDNETVNYVTPTPELLVTHSPSVCVYSGLVDGQYVSLGPEFGFSDDSKWGWFHIDPEFLGSAIKNFRYAIADDSIFISCGDSAYSQYISGEWKLTYASLDGTALTLIRHIDDNNSVTINLFDDNNF